MTNDDCPDDLGVIISFRKSSLVSFSVDAVPPEEEGTANSCSPEIKNGG